jgi:hypothetical protein
MRGVARVRHSRPLPLQASAAISFVRALGTNQASTGDSLSIPLTSDVPVRDTIIISFAMNPRTTGPNDGSCTDSRGNTWTVDGDVIRGSGIDGVRSATCSTWVSAALASGDSITMHHPSNSDERAMSASEFSGLRSNGLDRSATGVGIDTATPLTMATAATTIPNELVIGTIGVEGPPVAPDTFTPGSGFTSLDRAGTQGGRPAGSISVNAEYRIVTDVGADDPGDRPGGARRSRPRHHGFSVSGKGDLAPPDGTPVVATLILDTPFATTGQCGEADFGSCKKSKSGNALACS